MSDRQAITTSLHRAAQSVRRAEELLRVLRLACAGNPALDQIETTLAAAGGYIALADHLHNQPEPKEPKEK